MHRYSRCALQPPQSVHSEELLIKSRSVRQLWLMLFWDLELNQCYGLN